MQASKIVTTASILTLEGLLESRWSLGAAVKFCSRELDMTDTDALCSLAAITGYSISGPDCIFLIRTLMSATGSKCPQSFL